MSAAHLYFLNRLRSVRKTVALAQYRYLYLTPIGSVKKIRVSDSGSMLTQTCEITSTDYTVALKISPNGRYLIHLIDSSPYIRLYENSNWNTPGAVPNFSLVSQSFNTGSQAYWGFPGVEFSPDSEHIAYIASNGSTVRALYVYRLSDRALVYSESGVINASYCALAWESPTTFILFANVGSALPSVLARYSVTTGTKTYLGTWSNFPTYQFTHLELDLITGFAFVGSNNPSPANDMSFFNLNTNTYVSSTRLGGASDIRALKYEATLHKLFVHKLNNTIDIYDVTCTTSGTITPILTFSNTVSATFSTSYSQPNIGVFDTARRFLYCPDGTATHIKILDGNSSFADIASSTDVNRPPSNTMRIAIV